MGLPVSGSWYTRYANAPQYAGAAKWGTGNNPVHEAHGEGPPLRTLGRVPGPDMPSPELSDIPPLVETAYEYGYCMEDIETQGYFEGIIPGWGTDTTTLRATSDAGYLANPYDDYPPWNPDEDRTFGSVDGPAGYVNTEFRNTREMDEALWSGTRVKSFPTESVTEGWLNKETGSIHDARVSDSAQYERQTSMQQVNPAPGRNNDLAVQRGTDDARFNIMTRLTGMKIKPWSEGQRNSDMFPYQQDMIVRPFWYRIAAVDDPGKMEPNETYVSMPIQRDVPPDPYMGPSETDMYSAETDMSDGYTEEDLTYA